MIEVKYRLGRLELDEAPEAYIPVQRANHEVFELPFGEEAALRHVQLPGLLQPSDLTLGLDAVSAVEEVVKDGTSKHRFRHRFVSVLERQLPHGSRPGRT